MSERVVRENVTAEQNLGPPPFEPAVGLALRVTIDNQCGDVLTYRSATMEHGSLSITTERFDVGMKAQAFEARSTPGSGLGPEGRVVYAVGSGAAALQLDFSLASFDKSFTAGMTGDGASEYVLTVADAEPLLEPTITIARAR